jgi:hypothetical protein
MISQVLMMYALRNCVNKIWCLICWSILCQNGEKVVKKNVYLILWVFRRHNNWKTTIFLIFNISQARFGIKYIDSSQEILAKNPALFFATRRKPQIKWRVADIRGASASVKRVQILGVRTPISMRRHFGTIQDSNNTKREKSCNFVKYPTKNIWMKSWTHEVWQYFYIRVPVKENLILWATFFTCRKYFLKFLQAVSIW